MSGLPPTSLERLPGTKAVPAPRHESALACFPPLR